MIALKLFEQRVCHLGTGFLDVGLWRSNHMHPGMLFNPLPLRLGQSTAHLQQLVSGGALQDVATHVERRRSARTAHQGTAALRRNVRGMVDDELRLEAIAEP